MPFVVEAAELLQYRATGSTPLLYRAHFREREETSTTTSFIRFDQEKLEEKKDNRTRERALVLNRSVRRQGVEDRSDELSTRIVSLELSLPSQRIAEFFEETSGVPQETYSLEALPYFGIPLPLSKQPPVTGESWNASWRLQIEEGSEIPFVGHYRIDRVGLLAGHTCAFVSYNLQQVSLKASEDGERRIYSALTAGASGPAPAAQMGGSGGERDLPPTQWTGEGSFAFDLNRGVLVAHQARLSWKREMEEFQESARVLQKRETLYEMAEVLLP